MKNRILVILLAVFSVGPISCCQQKELKASNFQTFYEYKSINNIAYQIDSLKFELTLNKKDNFQEYTYLQLRSKNQFTFLLNFKEDETHFSEGYYIRNSEKIKIKCLAQKTYLIGGEKFSVYLLYYSIGSFDGGNYIFFSKEFGMLSKIHESWTFFWEIRSKESLSMHILSILKNDEEMKQYKKIQLSSPPTIN